MLWFKNRNLDIDWNSEQLLSVQIQSSNANTLAVAKMLSESLQMEGNIFLQKDREKNKYSDKHILGAIIFDDLLAIDEVVKTFVL